ncbi:MAG: GNAT family N-acetyltransferase [Thermomicrobiales bacterium]
MAETVRMGSTTMPEGFEVLHPSDVSSLRIPWDARYSRDEIAEIASSDPPLSLWNPRTGGYLIGGFWRHREDIANVVDIVGPAVSTELLEAFLIRCRQVGLKLAIVAEYSERRRESFYESGGMHLIEEIVVYELGRLPSASLARPGSPELIARVVDPETVDGFDELIRLDHRAFPWLWWNTPSEFENYASAPGVIIETLSTMDGKLVGYIGMTSLGSWGHLDRIAVDPDLQGQGFGRLLLDRSIQRLRSGGARRVALSTQASNTVSRALYESVGFRRSRNFDYRIYGTRLRDAG